MKKAVTAFAVIAIGIAAVVFIVKQMEPKFTNEPAPLIKGDERTWEEISRNASDDSMSSAQEYAAMNGHFEMNGLSYKSTGEELEFSKDDLAGAVIGAATLKGYDEENDAEYSDTVPVYLIPGTPSEKAVAVHIGRKIIVFEKTESNANGSMKGFAQILRELPESIKSFAEDHTMYYLKAENGTELLVGGWPGAVTVDIDEEALGIHNGDKVFVDFECIKETYPAQADADDITTIVKLRDASETELSERAKSEIESLRKMGWEI